MTSFEHDIRPFFREQDARAMSFAFDLTSYDDVRSNAEARPAERRLALDAGDVGSELGGADRGRVPGRTASEDGDVDVHPVSVPSVVGVCSRCASIVTESSSSPTRSKPWRSYSPIAPALLRSTLSEIVS